MSRNIMRAVGVVRKVDTLGRIVLPKSIRQNYDMGEGTPIEILVQDDHIILEKFKPKCVFCFSTEQVKEYLDRYICKSCVEEMSKLTS